MQVIETPIPDVLIIEPKLFVDTRGFFTELYQRERYAAHGIGTTFVQDNFSRSDQGVLRGLHFQNPKVQSKLVTVLRGCVLDVAVDVRVGSPTFARHLAVELDDVKRRELWIPRGFAHGFIVLSETADLFYKCDELYSAPDEFVLRWDDAELNIDWRHPAPVVSHRDGQGQTLAQLHASLPRYASC